jgi:YegS/Rv2252/BmrU family lipid kinase
MDYLVVNPNAGNGGDTKDWVRRLRDVDIEPRLWPDGPDERSSALTPEDRLLVAGGDGTLRRYARLCLASGSALGVLPAGTGNDFARGLGIPLDPPQACRLLASGDVVEVDVGRFEDDIFLNVVHVGIGSAVAPELSTEAKRWWGRFSYLRTAVSRMRDARGFTATIRCDGSTTNGRWMEIAIANGSSFGGGHQVFDASPFDGELDMVAVRFRPWYQLAAVWSWAWLRRSVPAHEAIVLRRGADCEIDSRRRRKVTADGDEVGKTPGRFSVLANALRVIVPSTKDRTDGQRMNDEPGEAI